MDASQPTLLRQPVGVGSRHGLLLTTAIALLLIVPAVASAATLAITVGADPTATITTQLGVAGTADADTVMDLTVKPVGGRPCAANPSADDGADVWTEYLRNTTAFGAFATSENWTFDTTGSYLLCAWLRYEAGETFPDTVVASASMTINVRVPKLSLTVAAPASVASGEVFPASITVQAEATRTATFGALPDTGRGCPANWQALFALPDRITFNDVTVSGGPTTFTENEHIDGTGRYLLCAYVQRSFSDAVPEVTATGAIIVSAPCLVPDLAARTTLAAMRATIVAAQCTIGAVAPQASTTVARGNVISLNPTPGTRLAPLSPVSIVVSDGAPCIVPYVAGKTLRVAKAVLVRAGCTAGRVMKRHSRRHARGRVIALTKKRNARLAPRAKVGIIVSSGRGKRR